MKIELSQSGGFAGEVIKLKDVHTDTIPAAAKTEINELLKKADFFNLKDTADKKEVGADLLTYHLKISETAGKSKEIAFTEPVSNKTLAKLVAVIKSL